MSAPTRLQSYNIKLKSKQLQQKKKKKNARASKRSPEQMKRRQQRKETEQETPSLIEVQVCKKRKTNRIPKKLQQNIRTTRSRHRTATKR